jgi:hypothetical protein
MQKNFYSVLLFVFVCTSAWAQQVDTLRNFPKELGIYAPKYASSNGWGYYLGLNQVANQQYAEKYHLVGGGKVLGVVAHLQGKYANPNNHVEFNVYEVGTNRLPGRRLNTHAIPYRSLDLSGNAYQVIFAKPVTVSDSFYVSFNVDDYLHGGYEGDTLGLMAGVLGSRKREDLVRFGRNVVQAHNHDREDWKDFYTQNFSPLTIHFALFPIVEWTEPTALADEKMATNGLVSYPNPMRDVLYIQQQSSLNNLSHVELKNLSGQTVLSKAITNNSEGNTATLDGLELLPKGMYLLMLHSNKGVLVQKIEKE